MRIITLRDTQISLNVLCHMFPQQSLFKNYNFFLDTNKWYNLGIMKNSNTLFVCAYCNHLGVITITLALDRIIRHISLDFLILDIKMI